MRDLVLTDIHTTPPLGAAESALLDTKLQLTLHHAAGESHPYKYAVGDRVIDTMTGAAATVLERYRDNGHNHYRIHESRAGGVREKDLQEG